MSKKQDKINTPAKDLCLENNKTKIQLKAKASTKNLGVSARITKQIKIEALNRQPTR
jgi:hypothetical protein